MCYNCGCERPDDQMGSPDNITNETFKKAAAAMGMTVQESMENTKRLIEKELPKHQDSKSVTA